jgi:HemY protein
MRAFLAVVLLAAAVAGGAFFADRPGRVEIVWQGWQVETSVAVLAAALALLLFAVSLLVLAAAGLRRLPGRLRRGRGDRRRRAGERALTGGLVALAAGNTAEAERQARRALTLLDNSPVALLLAAEAASRQGDTAAAQRAYVTLLDNRETEFLGLRGLIGQALRRGDDGAARQLAERARQLRPAAGWLSESALVLQARAGDWQAARETLAAAVRRRALPAERTRHQQGVVLYELSREAERQGDLRRAAGLGARAQAQAPDLAAIAAHHARLLLALGRGRTAFRAIERAWRNAPHPELARLYLDHGGDSGPLRRAAALQRLAARNPEAAESHLAIAEAALAAQLWGEARRHLALAEAAAPPAGPSRRLCLLMARLEESENGDTAASRVWLDRAVGAPPEPCYVCGQCGGESADWQSLCGACGAFDTLRWGSPAHRGAANRPIPLAAAPSILPAADNPALLPALPSRLAPTPQWDN